MGAVASPLGGSGGVLPQKIFRFISSEIASGVILNMFALFVTLLFWYSRSRRGASARSYGARHTFASLLYARPSKRVRLTCTIGCGATSF